MLPQAALVLVGGVIADRWDPRRVLIAGQVARAVVLVLGALAWRAGYDGAPTLLAIALAFGVAAGLTIPSGMALIRQIVNPDDFGTVIGWNQVSGRVMRLLGAPVGGILVAWGGLVARDGRGRRDVRGHRRRARARGPGAVPRCRAPSTPGGATRSSPAWATCAAPPPRASS